MLDVDSDVLLHLRRGHRQGFVRYFELYRDPVYNLVRWLLRDEEDAVSATKDAFTTAYRRILLADGLIDLKEWTFRAAFDVCHERQNGRVANDDPLGGEESGVRDTEGSLRRATPNAVTSTAPRESSEFARRFVQALGMVEFQDKAVLLLHDISELRLAELATVFGVTEDAAGVLLFRAREAFRRAFEDVSSDQRLASCRLAEQMAAGSVGGSLSDAELQRLDEHAAYCRDCRRTMKGWGTGALGLALCLGSVPLPTALEAAPVFGTPVPISGAANTAVGAGALKGVLARIGRAAASRAAAYALAAVCLTFALGLTVAHPWSDRTVIVLSATGLEGPQSARPAKDVARPPISPTTPTGPSAEASPVAARPAVSSSSASGSPRVIGLLAQVGSHAGVSEPTATTATDVALVADGRVAVAGSTSSSAALVAGLVQTGDARGLSKAQKTPHGAADTGPSARGDRGGAQPAAKQHSQKPQHAAAVAKQKAAKVGNQHAQKQHDNQAKTKNQNKNKNKND